MLRPSRRSALVASAASFAAIYAVLGAFPVSRLLLGSGNFLTASNFVTSLAGMVFGPVTGGLAVLVGDLIDSYAGYLTLGPVGAAVISADLATAVTAGLAFAGRRKAAMVVPLAVLAMYLVDPLSVLFVGPVPFAWLHMLSFGALALLLVLEGRGKLSKLSPVFVTGVSLASLLCGQLTGTLVGQELTVRVFGTMSEEAWRGLVNLFFPLYPVERVFFAVVGSLVAIPVLRALSRRR